MRILKNISKGCTIGIALGISLLGSSNVYAERLPIIKNQNTGVVFTDLALAITAASSGDTLKISGTCVGNFIINKTLNLIGGDDAVLDGNHLGSVLTITSSTATVRLNKLTIENGSAATGGGIRNIGAGTNGGILVINNSEIINNTATTAGGGIFSTGSASRLHLYNSKVAHNTLEAVGQAAASGGGIAITATGQGSIFNSKISNNSAGVTTGSNGGGILGVGAAITIVDTEIDNNIAAHGGGGGIANVGGGLTIENVHVTSNNGGQGGGILTAGALTTVNSLIHKNVSQTSGGGIALVAGAATLNDTDVRHNLAATVGGGIFAAAGTVLTLLESEVHDNTPDDIIQL